MPSIDIRPAVSNDIQTLVQLTHSSETSHTWQMNNLYEEGQIQASFRRIRLPRPFQLEYPRQPAAIANCWKRKDLFLVARIENQHCGYLTLEIIERQSARITDLVVDVPFRKQGVATALIFSAQDWLRSNGIYRVLLELPIKNEAAIALAEKLGYVYSGFMDGFFGNREIAFFYSLTVR
ncbi:MAG: GNAT family N-acetyltransferase [Anaerolineaceae bacterium]|nr:GNAT family N-acetyltransferase [Anaerolineaceae bacterium]